MDGRTSDEDAVAGVVVAVLVDQVTSAQTTTSTAAVVVVAAAGIPSCVGRAADGHVVGGRGSRSSSGGSGGGGGGGGTTVVAIAGGGTEAVPAGAACGHGGVQRSVAPSLALRRSVQAGRQARVSCTQPASCCCTHQVEEEQQQHQKAKRTRTHVQAPPHTRTHDLNSTTPPSPTTPTDGRTQDEEVTTLALISHERPSARGRTTAFTAQWRRY